MPRRPVEYLLEPIPDENLRPGPKKGYRLVRPRSSTLFQPEYGIGPVRQGDILSNEDGLYFIPTTTDPLVFEDSLIDTLDAYYDLSTVSMESPDLWEVRAYDWEIISDDPLEARANRLTHVRKANHMLKAYPYRQVREVKSDSPSVPFFETIGTTDDLATQWLKKRILDYIEDHPEYQHTLETDEDKVNWRATHDLIARMAPKVYREIG